MAKPTVLIGLHESFWKEIGAIFSDHHVHFVRQDYKRFRDVPPYSQLGDTSEVEIFVGSPSIIAKLLKDEKVPNLKWIQSSTSGNELLFKTMDQKSPAKLLLSRFPDAFPEPIAEYVLAMIIASSRQFFFYHRNQTKRQFEPFVSDANRLSKGKVVVILGLGEVGKCVAKLCKAAEMYTIGVKRTSVTSQQQLACVDECRLVTELDDILSRCDVIVNALPSTPETVGLLGGRTLSSGCQKPVFINVGRGDVISEQDILAALSNEWLSMAVLDVFEEEPLPPCSPLWTHPQVIITPHISGRVVQSQIVKQFGVFVRENYRRYKIGESPIAQVDIANGY